jgi:hypothetical protein
MEESLHFIVQIKLQGICLILEQVISYNLFKNIP